MYKNTANKEAGSFVVLKRYHQYHFNLSLVELKK